MRRKSSQFADGIISICEGQKNNDEFMLFVLFMLANK